MSCGRQQTADTATIWKTFRQNGNSIEFEHAGFEALVGVEHAVVISAVLSGGDFHLVPLHIVQDHGRGGAREKQVVSGGAEEDAELEQQLGRCRRKVQECEGARRESNPRDQEAAQKEGVVGQKTEFGREQRWD